MQENRSADFKTSFYAAVDGVLSLHYAGTFYSVLLLERAGPLLLWTLIMKPA